MALDWFPLWLSLRVAAVATLLALVPGLWLAQGLRRGVDGHAAVAVVPPTVLCGYLAVLLGGERGWVVGWTAAVLAALFEAVPLVALLGRAALTSVEGSYKRVAQSLGAPGWRVFWRVSLPLARWPILVAVGLVFSRVLGEVGLALLVAGFALGRGDVLDETLRRAVESGDGGAARILVVAISAVLMVALALAGSRITRQAPK